MKTKTLFTILAGSIAQLVHAAPFDSNGTGGGNWSDPATWDGSAFPDTYFFDSATILASDTVDYDDIGGNNGPETTPTGLNGTSGGLAVGNGNSLTIQGTLTQSTLTTEIRIGEATGGPGGVGTLTIDGGTFNTGASLGVGVGTSLVADGGGAPGGGNGLVNLNSGSFILGPGAALGGLGVGLNGSTGVINVGNGLGGAGAAILDLATNNVQMGIGSQFGAGTVGGTGTVTVNSDGQINLGNSNITVGSSSGHGLLVVNGTINGTGSGAIIVGTDESTVGELDVHTGGTINTGGELRIGSNGGAGTFNVDGGTVTITNEFNIGRGLGATNVPANGTATISGGVTTTGQISVGRDGGEGLLNLSGGTLATTPGSGAPTIVGNNGTGDVFITGGTLASDNYIALGVGNGGVGHVHQTAGSVTFNGWVSMGLNSNTASGSWDISGGSITSGAGLEVGSDGVGTMHISDTANINVAGFTVGVRTGSNGTAVMDNGNLASTGQINIGGGFQNNDPATSAATGTMTINGGTMSSANETRVGEGPGATGTFNINGGTVTSLGEFQAGNDQGTGTVYMTGGTLNPQSYFGIGRTGGTGVFNLSGGLITKTDGNGDFSISTYNNGAAVTTGTLNQSAGDILVTTVETDIGRDVGNVGFWNMSGGTATLANFHIGNTGVGTMSISGTDPVTINTTAQIELGANGSTSSGTLNIDNPNAVINVGAEMQLGRNGGHGEVHQTAGIVNANGGWFGLANDGTSPSGLYDISGGQLHVGPNIEDGAEGVGELRISGTGVVTSASIHLGQRINGTGILTVSDSGSLTTTGQIVIGFASPNNNVANIVGGTVTSGAETQVGEGAGNTGTLNLSGTGVLIAGGEFQDGNDGGSGIVNMSGGTLQPNSWFGIGRTGGTGIFNLSGGTIIKGTSANTGTLDISTFNNGAAVTTGTLNQTGGDIQNTISDTNVARDTGNVGFWNMLGGTAELAGLHIGNAGTGTLTVGGTDPVTITANNIRIGGEGGATGIGTLIISNPNAVITSTAEMGTGRNGGHGEVHQSAGILNAGGGWFGIANDPQDGSIPVSGLYDISGGQLNVTAGQIELGADGQGELRISGTGAVTANNVFLGLRTHGTGTLTVQDSGTLTTTGNIGIGQGSANANVANVSGGVVSIGGATQVGEGGGHTGTLNLSGTGVWISNNEIQVGNDDGVGVVNMAGGTMQPNSWFGLGRNGGTGTFNFSGGSIIKGTGPNNTGTFDIGVFGDGGIAGSIGTGTFNQTGGDYVNTIADTNIARDTSSLGIWNMSGGSMTLTGTNFNVGNNGNGTFNWSGGVITGPNVLNVANGSTAVAVMSVTGNDPLALSVTDNITVAANAGSVGTLNITDPNAVITAGRIQVGQNGGHGEVHQSAGSVTGGGGWFGIANNGTGSSGLYDISGGQLNVNTNFEIGADGLGTLSASGNSVVTVANDIKLGVRVTGVGTLNVTDSATVTATNGWIYVGGNGGGGSGTLNQSGGSVTTNQVRVGGNYGGQNSLGVINMSGGTLTGNDQMYIGLDGGTGTLNLEGGAITVNNTVNIGTNTGIGTVNLDAGVLTAQNISTDGTGTVSLSMNGGTMRAFGDEADFLRGFNATNSAVNVGGAVFDTNGHTVTVNNLFSGVGGLVKNGKGDLTVTNVGNAYTGGTTVNNGNLILPVMAVAGPTAVNIQINGPGAAALDGQDLNPLLAQTVATSNGAIALHNNTSAANLDFTSYPNLSLGSVGTSTFSNVLTPGGGNYRLGGGGGSLTYTPVLADVGGPTNLVVDGNGLTGTVILTAAGTYSGSTSVGSGTLVLNGGDNTLPSGTPLSIGATGIVDLNGTLETVGSLNGSVGGQLVNNGAATVFTTGGDNTNAVFGGVISGPTAIVKVGTGSQTIGAVQTSAPLTVNAGGVVLGGSSTVAALTLATNTTLALSAHAGGPGSIKSLNVSGLTLNGTSQVDITNNQMVINGASLASVVAKVTTGLYNGPNGYWDGPGIVSSTAANDVDQLTAVGVIDNGETGYSSFGGVALTGSEILVKYTYYGDADLNGGVTGDDFSLFVAGIRGEAPAEWLFGDFNYNGAVNGDDFSLFVNGIRNQGAVLRAADSAILEQEIGQMSAQLGVGDSSSLGIDASGAASAGQAVVPEPGSIGLLAVGAFGLIARRRKSVVRG